MNERGWFTLAVRIFGLVLTGYGIVTLIQALSYSVYSYITPTTSGGNPGYNVWWFVNSGVAGALELGFGVYFVFGASWLINALCRQVVDWCVLCGYSLMGTARDSGCPECGHERRQRSTAQPGVSA